jgi:hypothetical protein
MSYTPPTLSNSAIFSAYNSTKQTATSTPNVILSVDVVQGVNADSVSAGGVSLLAQTLLYGELRTDGVASYSDTYATALSTDLQDGQRGYQGGTNLVATVSLDDGNYIIANTGNAYLKTYAFASTARADSEISETRLFGLLLNN